MRKKLTGKKKIQVWVNPGFRKMLKRQALDHGLDVVSFTEMLAKKHKTPFKDLDKEEDIFEPISKNFKRIL